MGLGEWVMHGAQAAVGGSLEEGELGDPEEIEAALWDPPKPASGVEPDRPQSGERYLVRACSEADAVALLDPKPLGQRDQFCLGEELRDRPLVLSRSAPQVGEAERPVGARHLQPIPLQLTPGQLPTARHPQRPDSALGLQRTGEDPERGGPEDFRHVLQLVPKPGVGLV